MPKKSVLAGLCLAIGLTALTACSAVGSVSPQTHAAGHTVQTMCNTPQQPNCRSGAGY
jgi:hypothetical protein